MKHFSVAPSLTYKGRESRGLRGFSGKPFHPPLTDVPITAYLFAAVFDVLSLALYHGHEELARELFRAATWMLIGGAFVSVLAALTGWADWHRGCQPGTQVRRTVNTHATIMITVTTLILADLAVRLTSLDDEFSPAICVAVSVVAGVLVTVGAVYGGSLVFDHGFNVETAQDSPVACKREGRVPRPRVVTRIGGIPRSRRGHQRRDVVCQHNARIWARRASGPALRRSGSARSESGCW